MNIFKKNQIICIYDTIIIDAEFVLAILRHTHAWGSWVIKRSCDHGLDHVLQLHQRSWSPPETAWSTRYCTYHRRRPSLLDRSAVRIRINFWRMVGLYISFGRLSQCTWVLMVSVLETGHTRYCSISGSDPLRHSSSSRVLSLNTSYRQPPPGTTTTPLPPPHRHHHPHYYPTSRHGGGSIVDETNCSRTNAVRQNKGKMIIEHVVVLISYFIIHTSALKCGRVQSHLRWEDIFKFQIIQSPHRWQSYIFLLCIVHSIELM